LSLPVGQVANAKAALEAEAGILSVEEIARHDGVATLTAYPRPNTLIVENVSALARAERWDVKELYAEAGRLDDVFRAITTPDAQRARERVGASA
jgi:ABC-2 type transport system ATP-binding protein